jgi:hypothetical protein
MRRWGERACLGRSTCATGLLSTHPRLIEKAKMPCRKFKWFWTVLLDRPPARFCLR